MKLEAGKEMDRQCVMNWLIEVYVTPSRAFSEYTDDELKMFAHDALVLLKEQEAVEPKVSCTEQRCGHCNKVIEMDGWQFCPWCGKRIDWKGWWKKNGTRNQDS